MVSAIKKGYVQNEIAQSAFAYEMELEEKRKITVGMNLHVDPWRSTGARRLPARPGLAGGADPPAQGLKSRGTTPGWLPRWRPSGRRRPGRRGTRAT
jgi:hypothetical protein